MKAPRPTSFHKALLAGLAGERQKAADEAADENTGANKQPIDVHDRPPSDVDVESGLMPNSLTTKPLLFPGCKKCANSGAF